MGGAGCGTRISRHGRDMPRPRPRDRQEARGPCEEAMASQDPRSSASHSRPSISCSGEQKPGIQPAHGPVQSHQPGKTAKTLRRAGFEAVNQPAVLAVWDPRPINAGEASSAPRASSGLRSARAYWERRGVEASSRRPFNLVALRMGDGAGRAVGGPKVCSW